MIVKRHIETDLKRLHVLYSASIVGSDPNIPVYYCKIGVLELAGWIEESFDLIAKRSVKRRVNKKKFRKLVEKAINDNSGFLYNPNFLKMMAKLIGIPECEKLETYLASDGTLNILTSELEALATPRRIAAHVPLAFTGITFDTPSVSLGRLSKIHPILKDIYSWFC